MVNGKWQMVRGFLDSPRGYVCVSRTETVETAEVGELLETQVVNCIVPFYLIQQLIPLMKCDPTSDKFSFVVNVTAMVRCTALLRQHLTSLKCAHLSG